MINIINIILLGFESLANKFIHINKYTLAKRKYIRSIYFIHASIGSYPSISKRYQDGSCNVSTMIDGHYELFNSLESASIAESFYILRLWYINHRRVWLEEINKPLLPYPPNCPFHFQYETFRHKNKIIENQIKAIN